MRTINIAIVAITQGKNFVMHLRGGQDRERGALGLTGFLGGMIDDGETSLEAALRELREETNLDLTAAQLKKLGQVDVSSDFELEPVRVIAEVYGVDIPAGQTIKLNLDHEEVDMVDDTIVFIDTNGVKKLINENKLTPATKAAFEELL